MNQKKEKILMKAMVLSCMTNLVWGMPVWANETDQQNVETVVVTASKVEADTTKVAADINVISREEIERRHYSDVGAAVKDIAGVTLQNYGSTGETYTSNSLNINGSQNIVVLIDGMRFNTNGSVAGRIQPGELGGMDSIERIEVLKGSASTLYGSDAAGGVINIITRKALKNAPMKTTLGYEGGSYNRRQYRLSNKGAQDGFYWHINGVKRDVGDFRDGAGHRVVDRVHSKTYNVQLGKYLDEKAKVELNYMAYLSNYTRPKGGGIKPSNQVPKDGRKHNTRIALDYKQKINDTLKNDFSIFRNTNNLTDGIGVKDNWIMNISTWGVSDQLTYTKGKHTVIGGIDYYKDEMEKYQTSGVNSMMPSISFSDYYLQDDWMFHPKWDLISGIRLDHSSVYGNKLSPAFTLQYFPGEKTNIYASYKEFFVAPRLAQLYSANYGNANLKAEDGHQYEIGIKQELPGKTIATLSLWKRESNNVIAYQKMPGEVNGHYYNIGHEKAKGLSVGLQKTFTPHVDGTVSYTYTHIDPQIGKNPNQDGYIPVSAWNIGLNYHDSAFSASLLARGVINRMGRLADTYPNKLKTFWVVDATADYKVDENWKIYGGVYNVFNKYYSDRCYDLNPDNWYAQPGRNFKLGVEYTF